GEPAPRRVRAPRLDARRLPPRLHVLPVAREAVRAAGRDPVGRRAADARPRPSRDAAPEAAAPRRALTPPRAARRLRGVPDRPRAEPARGNGGAPRRAERADLAGDGVARVRAGGRIGRVRRNERGSRVTRCNPNELPRVLNGDMTAISLFQR